jgi:hypothetical protein
MSVQPVKGWPGLGSKRTTWLTTGAPSCTTSWRLVIGLALLAALWIAAVGTGTLGTDDSNHRLTMAHSWLTHTPEVAKDLPPPLSRKDTQHGIVGLDGHRVIFYDPGQSFLMLPIDWIGTQLANLRWSQDTKGVRVWVLNWLLFQPLNVALVLVCFWTMRLLGFEARLAALSSFLWLVGTTVLPYAQITWQNHQVLLFSLLSIALILKSRHSGARGLLLASGAAAGLAVLTRTSAMFHLLTAGLLLLLTLRQERVPAPEAFRRASIWALGAAPLVLAGRMFDYYRYGSFLKTGQSVWLAHINSDPLYQGLPLMPPGYPFINPASEGILGVLFSPAKSIFIYDPLLLPCLIVSALVWSRLNPYVRWLAVIALVNLAFHLALTSKLDFWHGDMAWGARYHITSVHLLLVALLPVLLQAILESRGVWAALGGLLLVGSTAVQTLAVTLPTGVEIATEDFKEPVICLQDEWNSKLQFRLGDRAWDLYCYASDSTAPLCPTQVARHAALAHPTECREMLEQFQRDNHLAFFPFQPFHHILGYHKELLLWWLLVGGALMGAVAWCFRLVQDLRRAAHPEVVLA